MKLATDRLTGTDWQRLVVAAADVIDDHVEELSRLDAAVGDGDHGINVATALRHARRAVARLDDPTPSNVLSVVASSFFEEMGGAAGALFGSFFRSAALSCAGHSTIGTAQLADAIEAGTEMVARRGNAHAGDKTMMDALLPAAGAGRAAAIADIPIGAALDRVAAAARRGAASTTTMVASLGRARYAEGKSVGIQDPGATTVALIIEAWAAAAGTEEEGERESL